MKGHEMKAPNGYGTVYKLSSNRRNPWTDRIQVGYKINNRGNPSADYRFLGHFKTRREAVEALAEYNYTKSSENLLKRKITLRELFAIQKSDVHLKERYIHIETSKTAASKRDIPIHLIIHPIVKTFIETNLDAFIPIPKLMQTRYPEANFRRWMQDFFPDTTKPHDTRHTFISMLQEIGRFS